MVSGMNRRTFLKTTAAAGFGVGGLARMLRRTNRRPKSFMSRSSACRAGARTTSRAS
jgi:hypothetical protein